MLIAVVIWRWFVFSGSDSYLNAFAYHWGTYCTINILIAVIFLMHSFPFPSDLRQLITYRRQNRLFVDMFGHLRRMASFLLLALLYIHSHFGWFQVPNSCLITCNHSAVSSCIDRFLCADLFLFQVLLFILSSRLSFVSILSRTKSELFHSVSVTVTSHTLIFIRSLSSHKMCLM